MKKPIDPNLNNMDESDFLLDKPAKKSETFGFNDYEKPKDETPHFSVQTKEERAKLPDVKVSSEDSSEGTHHHHHHHHSHSSSGSSHHNHHHSHHRHHHSSESKRKKKKLPLAAKIAIAIILLILLALAVVAGTFFFLRAQGHKDIMPVITEDTNYQETIEYNGHTYKYNEDIVSLGFVGVDQRNLQTVDKTDFVGAGDADLVIAVDTKSGKTKVIAIPRDTMVDVDIFSESKIFLRTEKTQLCLAYAYGDGAELSCEGAISAMSRVLYNVPIEKYFVLDLDGIAPLNDAIGGVTLESLYNFKKEGISVGETVTLKGNMAETYVRKRDDDNINASLNRTDRQIQYVKAYSQQVLPAVLKNFSTISSLYNTASDYSKTNLSLSNATYMGSLLLSKGVTSFDSYTLKGTMKASDDPVYPDVVHAEFYPDEDNLMQTVLDVFYIQID